MPTRRPCSSESVLDPSQHLGQARAGDDAVLDVVVGRDPPHGGERGLPPLPEERAVGVARRDADLERPALVADPLELGRVALDLLGDAVELDEEDGAGALRVPGSDGVLGRLDREPVHHLDRGRHDTGGDDPLHGRTRGVHRVERREQRAHRLRHADEPERDARHDAQRPLGADDDADEVRPVGVERLAAQLDDLAVREHEREPGHVVCGEAVLEAVGAARVLRDVPADRADLLARRVGRVEESVRRDGARHVEVRDSRLDDDPLAREVDLEDAVHPRQRDDDASGDRRRASGETGPGAARDERDALAMAGAQHRLDVLRRSGKDDELGNGSVARSARRTRRREAAPAR